MKAIRFGFIRKVYIHLVLCLAYTFIHVVLFREVASLSDVKGSTVASIASAVVYLSTLVMLTCCGFDHGIQSSITYLLLGLNTISTAHILTYFTCSFNHVHLILSLFSTLAISIFVLILANRQKDFVLMT